MSLLIDLLSWASLLTGSALSLIGALGMLRMPDFYTRTHASSLIDTGGAGLILVGLMLQNGFDLNLAKLICILAFLLFTCPTAIHALTKAALGDHLKPLLAEPLKPGQST